MCQFDRTATCFFPDVIRAPMSGSLGLNALLKAIDYDPGVILVDSAASTTTDFLTWFGKVYGALHKRGHQFRIIGSVTPDPASVSGFLAYPAALQDTVSYLVVKNETVFRAPAAWDHHPKAQAFVELLSPTVISMPHRDGGLQQLLREQSLTLAAVAGQTHDPSVKIETMYQILAEGLYDEVMAIFDKAQEAMQVADAKKREEAMRNE